LKCQKDLTPIAAGKQAGDSIFAKEIIFPGTLESKTFLSRLAQESGGEPRAVQTLREVC